MVGMDLASFSIDVARRNGLQTIWGSRTVAQRKVRIVRNSRLAVKPFPLCLPFLSASPDFPKGKGIMVIRGKNQS